MLISPSLPSSTSSSATQTKMGNCQAIDAATVVIQHPGGKTDKLFIPVNASEIMKTNPGHYVALLISTTLCSEQNTQKKPLRVTRIKLLRPTDTLGLGQVYRLITAQDVMKGLGGRKQAKMMKALSETVEKLPSEAEIKKENHYHHNLQVVVGNRHERQEQRSTPESKNSGATPRPRTWQPSLHTISEAST